MSHPWDDLVLGGVDRPRILIIDENFCTNSHFNEASLTGYIKTGAGTFTAELDTDSYGEYMANLVFSGAATITVDYEEDYGSAVLGKMFLVVIRVKSVYGCTIKIRSSVEHITLDIPASSETKTYFIICEVESGSGNSIYFRIQGTDDIDIRFDNLYLTEIEQDYVFPQPQKSNLLFKKVIDGENVLWNGKHQSFNFKYKPVYHCQYDSLVAVYEIYRQKISFNKILFCIPHQDVVWGFLAYWSEDFERRYPWDRFFGHKGLIVLEGSEYVYDLPYVQSGTGILYIDEEEIID